MSTETIQTIHPPQQATRECDAASIEPLSLNTGDRLSRAEFERRYEAHPEIKKAELVEGVVYVSSPVRIEQHSYPHLCVATWSGVYMAATPGVHGGDNGTTLIGFGDEVQPNVFLRLNPAQGGKSRINADDYLEGPPELVIEIAASSASYDLHDKKESYQRSGVQEYLAIQINEQRVDWFALREGVYQSLTPDENGVLHSEVFPGLWLQPAALWSGDLAAMLTTLQQGLDSQEHRDFVARLQP
jgi:Uma2 family endonuclease